MFAKDGTSKLVKELSYKTSGIRKVDLFVSDYAVFKFTEEGPRVVELLEDISIEELSEKVDFPLEFEKSFSLK